jgi:pyruvate dehydrogenase E2 component (dihydrolipoamide acetyltransferase)
LLSLKQKLAKIDVVAEVTLGHLAALAVARILADNPAFNRSADGALDSVDVGLGSDSGVRVIRNAQHLRLNELIAAAAQSSDETGGATTVTHANTGDVTHLSTSLAPGRSSAIGLGTIRSVFRPDAQGMPVLGQELGIVLTLDSRVFDAAAGTAFLNAIKASLENPLRILAG